jgi:hypothetical protein
MTNTEYLIYLAGVDDECEPGDPPADYWGHIPGHGTWVCESDATRYATAEKALAAIREELPRGAVSAAKVVVAAGTIDDTYEITIKFERGRSDDLECARMNFPDARTDDTALLAQFFIELQSMAYDDGGMAGFWRMSMSTLTMYGDADLKEAQFLADQHHREVARKAQWIRGISKGQSIASVGGPRLIVSSLDSNGSTATQDGKPAYFAVWAEHVGTEDPVYYERYGLGGAMLSHGYVDSVSRKLVQSG